MTQKTSTLKKSATQTRDEHEMLQHDNFEWLAEIRDVLSPYWSSRLEYHPDKKTHVLALEGTRPNNG
jgi:hypothetical protein